MNLRVESPARRRPLAAGVIAIALLGSVVSVAQSPKAAGSLGVQPPPAIAIVEIDGKSGRPVHDDKINVWIDGAEVPFLVHTDRNGIAHIPIASLPRPRP